MEICAFIQNIQVDIMDVFNAKRFQQTFIRQQKVVWQSIPPEPAPHKWQLEHIYHGVFSYLLARKSSSSAIPFCSSYDLKCILLEILRYNNCALHFDEHCVDVVWIVKTKIPCIIFTIINCVKLIISFLMGLGKIEESRFFMRVCY